MSTGLPVEFEAEARDGASGADGGPFRVEPRPGGFSVQGEMSTGSLGWTLSVSAVRHRRRVCVYVTARQEAELREAGLQQHGYRASVAGLVRGHYEVNVIHRVYGSGARASREAILRYSTRVTVGA